MSMKGEGAFQMMLVVKKPPVNAGRHKRCGLNSWVGKIRWRWAQQPTLVFLPGKSQEQKTLVGYSPWGGIESDTNVAT